MLDEEYVKVVQEVVRAFAPLQCVFDRRGSDYMKWLRFIVMDANDKRLSKTIVAHVTTLSDLADQVQAERARLIGLGHALHPWTPPQDWS
jgi:hypothetical protein